MIYKTASTNQVATLLLHMASFPAGTTFTIDDAAEVMGCRRARVMNYLSVPVRNGALKADLTCRGWEYRLADGVEVSRFGKYYVRVDGPESEEEALDWFETLPVRRLCKASDCSMPPNLGPNSVFALGATL